MKATITPSMVAKLRAETDAPMMECKKALVEAKGDFARAKELLRIRLGNTVTKVATRATAEGIIAAHISDDRGALVELNCETDFVAKNKDFLAFADQVAKLITVHAPTNVAALLALPISTDNTNNTVSDACTALIGKLGENLTIRRFVHYQTEYKLAYYLHGTRIGALVEYNGLQSQVGKDVAMHIAAMQPVSLSADDVPSELIAQERSIAEQKAAASGKPAEIIAKMVQGSVEKYLKAVSLLNQPFVKNEKQTIEQMLKATNTSVKRFTLYVAGAGIDRRQDNFAAEVAAQVEAARS